MVSCILFKITRIDGIFCRFNSRFGVCATLSGFFEKIKADKKAIDKDHKKWYNVQCKISGRKEL